MSVYEIAHINEQGVDLIIVPLKSSFHNKSNSEKDEFVYWLQNCATNAGLAGTVIPVWNTPFGDFAFLAPQNYHPFFKSINMNFVAANINRKLTCA